MSASEASATSRIPAWLDRYTRPREGWLSLFLLLVMLLSLAWSVQRAAWIDHEDYLVPIAFYGAVLGTILALSALRTIAALPIAAAVGSFIVLWAVGGEYYPALSQVDRLVRLRADAFDWALDISRLAYPNQLSPYAIGLAVITWVTAVIAAYTLFRHHRAIDAILLVGASLIVNLSATLTDLFGYLLVFSFAALLLWLRAALLTREDNWRRRRVNENQEVSTSIMRTGVTFIVGTIALSWLLSSVAVAAPLTDAWRGLGDTWSGVQDTLNQVFGNLQGPSRFPGTSFGTRFIVSGQWTSDDTPVLMLGADRAYYLGTVSYDVYTGHGWSSTQGQQRDVPAQGDLFPDGTPEQPIAKQGFTTQRVTVQLLDPSNRNLFYPGFPLSVSAPATVTEPAGKPLLGALSSTSSIGKGEGYSVVTMISSTTEAQLRGAGTAYPKAITELYLGTNGVTDRTRQLAQEIVDKSNARTPYDKAKALAAYLTNGRNGLTYSTNVGPPPGDQDLVDFFLFDGRQGYCQYFASAMAVMARTQGLPARVVVGYAPGESAGKDLFKYRASNAHVWTEIYFPGYGWQIFEATKSIDPKFARAAGGQVGPQIVTDPNEIAKRNVQSGIINEFAIPSVQPIPGTTLGGSNSSQQSTNSGRPNGLLILGIIVLAGLAFFAWRLRRLNLRLRFLPPGERQWVLLLQAAERAGVQQRPSETDYEYAGWLEEQIPERRPEIRTLAQAKVLGTYSRGGMTGDIIETMKAAWSRLRLPLVWLAIRRRTRALLPIKLRS